MARTRMAVSFGGACLRLRHQLYPIREGPCLVDSLHSLPNDARNNFGRPHAAGAGNKRRGPNRTAPHFFKAREKWKMATIRKITRDAKIFARDGFRCGYLGNRFETWRYLIVDHFKARAKCGSYGAEENFVTACLDCNSIKSDVFPLVPGHCKNETW